MSNRRKPVIERLQTASQQGPLKTRIKARKKLEKMYEKGLESDRAEKEEA